MLLERQKRPQALLHLPGGEIGGRDFQRLLFLYRSEVEDMACNEFPPHKYGGCALSSYNYD